MSTRENMRFADLRDSPSKRPHLCSIPPDRPFLDTLAAFWLRRAGDDPLRISAGLILLPTLRAARGLQEAFLRQKNGQPMLLPRIGVLGGLDETGLALSGALELLPPVGRLQRLAELARLVMQMGGVDGAPQTVDRAWPLAMELAALLDEAGRAEVDLPARLPGAAGAGFAEHWQRSLVFLQIVTAAWPEWLRDNGLMDVGARQVALLDAQAEAWRLCPPTEPVLVAGTASAIPAVARFLRVVAGLPNGLVVLPGLDCAMAEEAWNALETNHPQAALRHLLIAIGATRGDVTEWDQPGQPPSPRVDLLRRAMLPARALDDWRCPQNQPVAQAVWRLQPEDQQHEATAIALVLRDALETPGTRAALVTPDRDLALRVSAELLRFDVVADDSAGEVLAETPPAGFMRLLAAAVAADFAPVPLLALLKHPLTAAGMAPAACRSAARHLELACLRGPRPAPGLAGLRQALPTTALTATTLVDAVERALGPLLQVWQRDLVPPTEALTALIAAAELLAHADKPGPARLWSGEDGSALACLLSEAREALARLPLQSPETLPGLFDALLAGETIRSRRALRGRDNLAEHPRIFIWGLREAQLQTAEVMVLGGLAETVWPPATDPGPWMSRPMRQAVGLPSPEEQVGRMAHDFVMAACGAGQVILSCPKRRDGAPTVPARWLTRLQAFLAGYQQTLPLHPATIWALALDRPDGPAQPVPPPTPCPPVERRPRRLSVTEIETWLRDPYAIHARHILRLKALDGLDEPTDAADYGSVVHEGIAAFLQEVGAAYPKDARDRLRVAMNQALDRAGLRPALTAWWRPRLARIADWVAAEEIRRREDENLSAIQSEVTGEWVLSCPAGPFTLRGRADRIEARSQAGLAILDYKTGMPPSQAEVEAGLAPQLPLEAVMAAAGAFGKALCAPVTELTYWHLSGGFIAGEARKLFKGDAARVAEAMETARTRLHQLMADFDNPDRPYLSQPHPGAAPRFSVYAQLARQAEWGMTEDIS